jgi:hypothetical protein
MAALQIFVLKVNLSFAASLGDFVGILGDWGN